MEHMVPRGRYRQQLVAVDGQYTRSTHADPERHDRTNRSIATPNLAPRIAGSLAERHELMLSPVERNEPGRLPNACRARRPTVQPARTAGSLVWYGR